MFSIFIKPLNSSKNRFIFLGWFGSMDEIDNVVKRYIFSPLSDDPIFKRSLIQIYPSRFFEIMVKDANNDEEIFLKTYDVETCEFVKEAESWLLILNI